jgi:hypothetical protein
MVGYAATSRIVLGSLVARTLAALALVLSVVLPGSASASPIFVYDFVTDSCVVRSGPSYACAESYLNAMSVQLTLDAVQARHADYLYSQPIGWPLNIQYSNNGFAWIDAYDMTFRFNPYLISDYYSAPPDAGPQLVRCPYPCLVSANFDLGPSPQQLVAGNFVDTGVYGDVNMSGAGGEWTGSASADFIVYPEDFTGHWQLVRVLPEPPSGLLACTALLVMFGIGANSKLDRRRRPAAPRV